MSTTVTLCVMHVVSIQFMAVQLCVVYGGGCAEFFTKYLKSEVSKQVRQCQSLQPSDTKRLSSQVPGDTKTVSSQVCQCESAQPGDTKTSLAQVPCDTQSLSSQVCQFQSVQPGDTKTSLAQVPGDTQSLSSQVCQCQSLQPGDTKTSSSQVCQCQSVEPGDTKTSSSQVCQSQSVQPGDTKTSSSQVRDDTKMSSSVVTSTDNSAAHTALVSRFPPTTHNVSLLSPSDLLAQLKVKLTVCVQASVTWWIVSPAAGRVISLIIINRQLKELSMINLAINLDFSLAL